MPIFKNTRTSVSSATAADTAETRPSSDPANARYVNGRDKSGMTKGRSFGIRLSLDEANDVEFIEVFDELSAADKPKKLAKKLQSFFDNILVAGYNPGKGEHEHTRYINVKMLDDDGGTVDAAFVRLDEHIDTDVDMIAELDALYEQEPALADAFATEWVRACKPTYNSALKRKRTYSKW